MIRETTSSTLGAETPPSATLGFTQRWHAAWKRMPTILSAAFYPLLNSYMLILTGVVMVIAGGAISL